MIRTKHEMFREIRIKKGFSQRGLGRAANLSGALINQIENDERNPSPDSAKKICNALEVEFDDIFFTESVCSSKQENKQAI